jgi:hypothetical protein
MGINDLPKPGINFKATLGPGSFQRKLSSASRYGDLKNLRDNQKAIVGAVKKYQGVIRTRGGLSQLQKRDAWLKIKASDKTITEGDRREIKKVLSHLGRAAATGQDKTAGGKKAVKAGDGRSYLTKNQVAKNLKFNIQRDESGLIKREYKTSFAGGRISTKSIGVKSTMEEIGVKRGATGFARNYHNTKLPGNPAPKPPSTGIRPIGL